MTAEHYHNQGIDTKTIAVTAVENLSPFHKKRKLIVGLFPNTTDGLEGEEADFLGELHCLALDRAFTGGKAEIITAAKVPEYAVSLIAMGYDQNSVRTVLSGIADRPVIVVEARNGHQSLAFVGVDPQMPISLGDGRGVDMAVLSRQKSQEAIS